MERLLQAVEAERAKREAEAAPKLPDASALLAEAKAVAAEPKPSHAAAEAFAAALITMYGRKCAISALQHALYQLRK
jgi:hypothetical protein